jgi:Ni/Co efflux regulator RcnB
MNSALIKLLIAFVAVTSLYSSALSQSEWEQFERTRDGQHQTYIHKNVRRDGGEVRIRTLVNYNPPRSHQSTYKGVLKNVGSIENSETINCKYKTRSVNIVEYYSNNWGSGYQLGIEMRTDTNSIYKYSEEEWRLSNYGERFCKKQWGLW